MALVAISRSCVSGTFGNAVVAFLVATLLSGCTCSRTDEGSKAQPNASTDAGATASGDIKNPLTPPRCIEGSAQQTLHALGGRPSTGDDQAYAPFGVEVGAALVDAFGFWVPWLSSDGKSSHVGITVLGPDLLTARTVELGEVKWDGGPPRLARVNRDVVLAAIPDSDANGGSYRVAEIGPSKFVWGADVDGSSDDSPAFDFAASGERALLVWDDYLREQGRGTIRGNLIAANGQLIRDLESISPPESDVELPRLVPHAGGYWLAWLRVKWQPSKDVRTSSSAGLDVVDPEQPVLTPKARWVEVVPLDTSGAVTGAVQRVSSAESMVQGYDLQSGHDGALLVTWREDFSNQGTSGGQVWIARLSPDGSMEQHPTKTPELGGTLPVFLFDPKAPSGLPHGWLTLESARGETALAALSPFGKPLEPLASVDEVGNASILAALDGQLLLAEPKGRDVALSLIRCKYEPRGEKADGGAP
jgi:hypothetical protein